MALLKELPQLRDTAAPKREKLFQDKLSLCSIIFDFDDPNADKRGKELKRQTLLELVDFVNTSAGQKIFTETLMPDIMVCVRANICRCLPPQTEDYDPEEDEPVLEPSWPHLQVVYEFFLRFIVSSEVNAKVAKRYVDPSFCYQLIELFDSEDPRERDYLKVGRRPSPLVVALRRHPPSSPWRRGSRSGDRDRSGRHRALKRRETRACERTDWGRGETERARRAGGRRSAVGGRRGAVVFSGAGSLALLAVSA